MSIKPSVVYIKGVHDIADSNPSTAPDIGFPNIGLDKLFEGAILKEYTGDYDPNKKFIYKENLYNKSIESLAQFTCLKDGYSIPPANVQEYFYKNGNNYVKHIVPDLNTWENKLNESNFIKDKIIYTISNPNSWTYVKINSDYYDCTNNGYDKKTVNTYHCYDIIEVDLKYEYISKFDVDIGKFIWSVTNDGILQDGFFIYKNGTTIKSLGYIKFDTDFQISEGSTYGESAKIYRINYNSSFYIIESGKMKKVENIGDLYTTDDGQIYNYVSNYTYPNISSYQADVICDSSGQVITNTFNLYKELATPTIISLVPYDQVIIYEKTAVKVNYYYSNEASSLQFVFTDKDIDGVITACGLPDSVKKYVHLTNLKYNDRRVS